MDKVKSGGPAFPRAGFESTYPTKRADPEDGMSLRDYFAAAALTGFLARTGVGVIAEETATRAYEYADAMLKERAK